MAIWHYRLVLLPTQAVVEKYGALPVTLPEQALSDDLTWWAGYELPLGLSEWISELAPEVKSWGGPLRKTWAKSHGSEINVIYTGSGQVEWISCKVDLQAEWQGFAVGLCRLAARLGCIFVNSNSHILKPEPEILIEDIRTSTAAKYLENPGDALNSFPSAKDKHRISKLRDKHD